MEKYSCKHTRNFSWPTSGTRNDDVFFDALSSYVRRGAESTLRVRKFDSKGRYYIAFLSSEIPMKN